LTGSRRNFFFTLFEDMSTNPPDPKRPSRRNQKTDAEWAEIVDAYKRGLSLSQIKKKWSVGDVALHKRIRLLVEAGELPPPPPPRRLDWEKVAKDYQNYTVPMRVIAKWHNVSLETLGALITRRRASGRWNVPSRQEVLNWNWDLVKQYFVSGLTLPEIAKKVGRSEAMLYRRVYQFWADGVWPVAFVPKRGKRKKTTPEK
jgi:transposase-like protein